MVKWKANTFTFISKGQWPFNDGVPLLFLKAMILLLLVTTYLVSGRYKKSRWLSLQIAEYSFIEQVDLF